MGSATAPGLLNPLIRPATAADALEISHLLGVLGYPCDEADATRRITALSISDAAQRRGIGRALLRDAEVRARAAGAARIELTTARHRAEAHAFYRACGYEETSLRFMKRLGDA